MNTFPKVPPSYFLEKLSPEDRRRHFPGVAGMTVDEVRKVAIATSETELQRQLEQMLLRHGIQPTRQRMDRKSNIAVGMPDISFSVHGRAVYWEVKMPGRDPDPDQVAMIAKLSAAPMSAHVRVVTSYMEAFTDLQSLLKSQPTNI